LAADTAAEAWCAQVLADPTLPPAIQGVVMEGLVHLFEAHTTLGLADRRADAYAMHQVEEASRRGPREAGAFAIFNVAWTKQLSERALVLTYNLQPCVCVCQGWVGGG
jgi:hypothetical protein